MVRWVLLLAGLCVVSAVLGLSPLVPLASSTQSILLTLTAISATFLISAFDALETQTVRVERDEDH